MFFSPSCCRNHGTISSIWFRTGVFWWGHSDKGTFCLEFFYLLLSPCSYFFITAGEGWSKLPLYYWQVFCHQPYQGRSLLPRSFSWESSLFWNCRLLLSYVFNITFQFQLGKTRPDRCVTRVNWLMFVPLHKEDFINTSRKSLKIVRQVFWNSHKLNQ